MQRTDVLVIGTGLAGLCAAWQASRAGADVTLVSMGTPGADCTTVTAFAVASGAFGGMSPDEYAAMLEEKACGIGRPELRRILADESPRWAQELSQAGVEFEQHRGRIVMPGPYGYRARPACAALVDALRRAGARFIAPATATGLLLDAGRVCGALLRSGPRAFPIPAGAVVLAGGGFAPLMPFHDNLSATSGELLALAAAAGAQLVNMEFMSYQPPGPAEPGYRMDSLWARPLVTLGRWTTPDGREIRPSEADSYIRQRATLPGWRDDRYDLYCDLSTVPPEKLQSPEARQAIEAVGLRTWDFSRPLRLCPMTHYTFGGIEADGDGFTGVPGLHAAGECTGSLFGADRPAGGALIDCIVFGSRAGRAAAQAASRAGQLPSRAECIELKPLPPDASSAIRWQVSWTLWNFAGPYKLGELLDAASAELEKLSARVAQQRPVLGQAPASPAAAAAVAVAWAYVQASAQRAETRGQHRRLDHPDQDPAGHELEIRFAAADLPLHIQRSEVALQ